MRRTVVGHDPNAPVIRHCYGDKIGFIGVYAVAVEINQAKVKCCKSGCHLRGTDFTPVVQDVVAVDQVFGIPVFQQGICKHQG